MIGALARSTFDTSLILGLRLLTLAGSLILLTHLMPPAIYGPYAALAALATLLGLVPTLGCGYLMLAASAQGREAVEDIWCGAWPASLGVATVLLGGFLLLAHALGLDLHLSLAVTLGLGLIELVMMPLILLCSWAHQAHHLVARGQLLQWLPLGLRLLALLPCALIDSLSNLEAFIVGQVLAAGLALFMVLGLTLRGLNLSSTPRRLSFAQWRKGLTYCAMHMVAMNPSEIDKIVIAKVASAHDAGIYAITNRVLGALMTPVSALLLAAQPRLFQLNSHSANQSQTRLVRLLALFSALGGACAAGALAIGSLALPWILGSSYSETATLAPLLACAALPLALRISSGTILVANGQPERRLVFEMSGIPVLLGLIIWLVPSYGLSGTAIALAGAEAFMAGVGWWLVFRTLRKQANAEDPCRRR
ncbi:polysaccharide biosynthesis C-terminal domain-containing protein [Pseudomonas nicosulfuronedens]|uniref:Uncharacterized protein n=1 Tax=Pseudomonas nicosulfuronedens TaxID=2571105 RepID=A0A5R9RAS4_9PSED|nr:polysaccharide biosynthesis C-terminal domain-containing protein [Pseudomonas nicosulfuronedens]MDH1007820.1 polysaccharide biosynthesis C-terminal domain-containing protein [Pseudomonas nicosulfuronedens]MDH1982536.1 polysaccharide biosynthesis C-terminal domain-containing protein [Pseudomonas nicosulfuronedens]MDH2024931.1 polysaccharide biosynthesis C-terminal domain-containing protein [Pseudomonas nicosulfuronedens]TLX79301.1 hypothetical protein FAS41_08150 [Pseudomonas nicosulfuroneden